METNSYILERTMNEYERLLVQIEEAGFIFKKESDDKDVKVSVPFPRIDEFTNIIQSHIDKPFDYVNVNYPKENKLYLIFGAKTIVITNKTENEAAKKWAINLGLPPEQADWAHWFK